MSNRRFTFCHLGVFFLGLTLCTSLPSSAQLLTVRSLWGQGEGSRDGAGADARFYWPQGMVSDGGDGLFVADSANHTIRHITKDGRVTTFAGVAGMAGHADGAAAEARFFNPTDLALDDSGNLFVVDTGNAKLRKISISEKVTTIETRGPTNFMPAGIATHDGTLYVTSLDHTVRVIAADGAMSVLAGRSGEEGSRNGVGSAATFTSPHKIVVNHTGELFVGDSSRSMIRVVSRDGVVSSLFKPGQLAFSPRGMAIDALGNLYAGFEGRDERNRQVATIRMRSPEGTWSTFAGGLPGHIDGARASARFTSPWAMAIDQSNDIYVAELSNVIRRVTEEKVTTLAGIPSYGPPIWDVVADGHGNVIVSEKSGLYKINDRGERSLIFEMSSPCGLVDGPLPTGVICGASPLARGHHGDFYFMDNGRLRHLSEDMVVTTIAGGDDPTVVDGTGAEARFRNPADLIAMPDGTVWMIDGETAIRAVTPGGTVTTVAGAVDDRAFVDGVGSAARFIAPSALVDDAAGNILIADWGSGAIRKLTTDGTVSTLGGFRGLNAECGYYGRAGLFCGPADLVLDRTTGDLYVLDRIHIDSGSAIRRVSPDGYVTTVAGDYQDGYRSGTGSNARFKTRMLELLQPGRLVMAALDELLVAEPSLAGSASIDEHEGPVGGARRLSSDSPANSWRWSVIRRPTGSTAEIIFANQANATFTPDTAGLFTFELYASDGSRSSITTVNLSVQEPVPARRRAARH